MIAVDTGNQHRNRTQNQPAGLRETATHALFVAVVSSRPIGLTHELLHLLARVSQLFPVLLVVVVILRHSLVAIGCPHLLLDPLLQLLRLLLVGEIVNLGDTLLVILELLVVVELVIALLSACTIFPLDPSTELVVVLQRRGARDNRLEFAR